VIAGQFFLAAPATTEESTMACDHDENDDIQSELGRLTGPVARTPAPRIAGTPITLYVDSTEANEQLKLDALDEALGLVHARTGERFDGLTVYLGGPCRCIAYAGESGGDRSQVLFLGDQMLVKTATAMSEKASGVKGGYGAAERGVADQRYDDQRKNVLNPTRLFASKASYQAAKLHAKAVAVIVHEFGHLLHERLHSGTFWNLKREKNVEGAANDRPPATLAVQVSQYATKSKLEFTAEVFTGLIYGKHYAPAVISQYQEYGGVDVH